MQSPRVMFANLLQLILGRSRPGYERNFVKEVTVSERSPRNRRLERLILFGWVLILIKSWLIIWVVDRYHVPINPLWVIVPTVMFAALCTLVYFRRD